MDILEAIRQKRQTLEALKEQVSVLERELREISATAEGKEERHARLPFARGGRKRRSHGMQEGSTTEMAFKVLDAANEALLVEDILARIGEKFGKAVDKPTLVSNLARYVQRKDTFTRVRPNTYGLRKYMTRDLAQGGSGD